MSVPSLRRGHPSSSSRSVCSGAATRLPLKLRARAGGVEQRRLEGHVEPPFGCRLDPRPPGECDQRPPEPGGTGSLRARSISAQAVGVEHRLGGEVECALSRADDRAPVRLGDVVGMRHLEAEPRQVGNDRDAVRGEEPVRHPAAREELLHLRPHRPLEDQRGAEAHCPRVGVVAFEAVEDALDLGLVA